MKKKRRIFQSMALVLASVIMAGLLGMTGCGKTGTEGNGIADGTGSADETGNADGTGMGKNEGEGMEAAGKNGDSDGEQVMGRYLEEMDDSLKDELGVESRLERMNDGSLVVMTTMTDSRWVSKDNGITWEKEELAWYKEMNASNWLMDIAVAKDGYTAVIYEPKEQDGGAAAGVEGADSGEDEDGEEEDPVDAEEGIEMQTMDFSSHPQYRLIAPDGSFTEIDLPYKDAEYVNRFAFSDDGRLFGAALGGKVYEINREDGSCRELTELPRWAQHMAAKGDKLMLADGSGITIMDLSTGETIEDKVLDDFMKEQGNALEYHTTGIHPLLILPGEEDILYLVFEKGIYRHVIGGNVIEQVVDGTLTSLGDPSNGLADGVLLENDVFLLLFSGGEIVRYTYDPDVPAVPEIQVRAYSLTENQQLKTVISSYQAKHPEVYIRYEAGMGEDSAVTREDALKKLNTEIAAGLGPDIFILDDMPMDSYIEKGVLADLSPYLEGMEEDRYFTNILRAFRTQEGIYGVPAQFQIALLTGKEEDIAKMTDLEAIAGIVEAYRADKGEGLIFGARGEDEMLNKLLPVCMPAWKDAEGKIDEEALTEFYTLAKRIWDAENEGMSDETREQYEEWLEDMRASGATEEEIRRHQHSMNGMIEYLTGDREFAAGMMDSSFDLDVMISCFKIRGRTDSGFVPYKGQAEGVFAPISIMGIGETSVHKDIAVELLTEMLDDDGWNGMPVNKEKCRERFLINATEDGGSYGSMGVVSEDGNTSIGLDIYPASEEEIALLMKAAEEGHTPYVEDSVLENAVCNAGVKVLRGEMSASAGAKEVLAKTAIYMSE